MCRPTNNSTKQHRRVSLEDVRTDPCINVQKDALHQECTVSTASTSSSEDTVNIPSQHYPVTGRYSDVNADYAVSNIVFGSGHYGTVRQCIHRATGQTFAVKSIQKFNIRRIDHLQREIHLLFKMNHENITNMIDCYEDEKYIHIVTEEYTGGELFDKIVENTTNNGCLSEAESAKIIEQLLKAVSYLHENDCVHRDIKPENILFESRNENSSIRLIDFGLSRIHSEGEEMMSNPVGTAYYMSPELLKGKYDRTTDMWSIGVVAYILLCGYPPFNGNSDAEIAAAIRRGHYTFVDGWGGKSVEALDFIKCLLKRDPRKRHTAKDALKHPWFKLFSETPMEF